MTPYVLFWTPAGQKRRRQRGRTDGVEKTYPSVVNHENSIGFVDAQYITIYIYIVFVRASVGTLHGIQRKKKKTHPNILL